MSGATGPGLLAIDVGTSCVKLGWFPDAACDSEKMSQLPIAAPRLPAPAETFEFRHRISDLELAGTLGGWLSQFLDRPRVAMASVHSEAAWCVQQVLRVREFEQPQILETTKLPIEYNVDEPDRVGIDRALAAMAVNRIRASEAPAIVISLGTACTVNLISEDGVFQGGAIMPGLALAANSLHRGATSLPLIELSTPSSAVGKNTVQAITVGVVWGTVGAIEKLIAEYSRVSGLPPQLFLTGGDAPLVLESLEASGHHVRLMPHLVLSGIAIACEAEP